MFVSSCRLSCWYSAVATIKKPGSGRYGFLCQMQIRRPPLEHRPKWGKSQARAAKGQRGLRMHLRHEINHGLERITKNLV